MFQVKARSSRTVVGTAGIAGTVICAFVQLQAPVLQANPNHIDASQQDDLPTDR